MHRRRRGGRGRRPIQPDISRRPAIERLDPQPPSNKAPVFMDLAEAEVLRLVDLDGLYQEQAGFNMGISRGTVWRLLASAREKVAKAIFEGRSLVIGHPDES